MTNQLTKQEQSVKTAIRTFSSDACVERLNEVARGHGEEIASIIISCIQKTPALAECTEQSIMGAALAAYVTGLNFATNEAYMIPYDGEAQYQVGWKGIVQLAQRSGYYEKINAMEVKEGELVDYDPLEETYTFNWIKDKRARAKLPTIGYIMYFKLINGFVKKDYWTIEEMQMHAEEFSQSYKNDIKYGKKNSYWSKNFDQMGLKTMYKLTLDKFGPKSVKMQKAFQQDQATLKINPNAENGKEKIEVEAYVDNQNNKTGEIIEAEEVPVEVEAFVDNNQIHTLCETIVSKTNMKVPEFMDKEGITDITKLTVKRYEEFMKELNK